MVFLTLNGLAAPERFVDALKEQGILINGADHGVYRLVTHWGIEDRGSAADCRSDRPLQKGNCNGL